MKIKKAEIKLDPQGFNSLPEKATVMEALEEAGKGVEVVDVAAAFFENSLDTLVVAIDDDNAFAALHLGKFATNMGADEFNFLKVEKKLAVRFWWD